MKANRIAMLGLAVLLGSTVYGNVSVIKAENDQLEEGLDAIEDAIGKGKDSDSENNSQSASEEETDMQEGTSDNTIGTPDDFPAAYDFGSGKISDFSRDYMLKKMLEPEQNDTVLNTDADPDNIQVLYLWEEGNIPAKTKFTKDMTGYFDNWDFRPYVTAIPVRKGVTPKGAVVLMAGGAYQFRGNYTDSLPTQLLSVNMVPDIYCRTTGFLLILRKRVRLMLPEPSGLSEKMQMYMELTQMILQSWDFLPEEFRQVSFLCITMRM